MELQTVHLLEERAKSKDQSQCMKGGQKDAKRRGNEEGKEGAGKGTSSAANRRTAVNGVSSGTFILKYKLELISR